jgi:hypothetical protein
MHYEREDLGFSFDLPDGWRHDEHNLTLSFYGPRGGLGVMSELIQISIGTILPQYQTPSSREQFLAEPGAEVSRSRVGDEENVVVLRRVRDSEISVVRDGVQYTIMHFHDAVSEAAIGCLKRTARFGSPDRAQAAIRSWSDPGNQAISRMLHGKIPAPAPQTSPAARPVSKGGFFGRLLGLFRSEPEVQKCETCSHEMQVLDFAGRGAVTLSRDEMASGVAQAEQCWECGRVYCAECYPSRPPNTCVCGRGRDAVRHIGGTVYRGSLRLVKVRYVS